MRKCTEEEVAEAREMSRDVLTEILKQGAHEMLARTVEAEVAEWIEAHREVVDGKGRRQVVRNGHLPEREILSGVGPVEVRVPRVHDRRKREEREIFESRIVPRYLRKTKTIEEFIPWLYLKGISTGEMLPTLEALVGTRAVGLSPGVVGRLKTCWEKEYRSWNERPLDGKEYVYVWADGIHFNIRLETDRQCILVLMGATKEGRKELIAVTDGFRESEASWAELLLSCKQRGLTTAPKVAVGDGALGFWAALRKEYPGTREQRCWVHKTKNVLNKLPKHLQAKAKQDLQQIWMAESRREAEKAFDRFLQTYGAKYPKAAECLAGDRDVLLTFYDFPAEHWIHIRTTNPIESTFSSVRLRTYRTKGCGSRMACLTMVYKLMESAAKRWRTLNGAGLLLELVVGVRFVDGLKVAA